jgi:hypothetical protein
VSPTTTGKEVLCLVGDGCFNGTANTALAAHRRCEGGGDKQEAQDHRIDCVHDGSFGSV